MPHGSQPLQSETGSQAAQSMDFFPIFLSLKGMPVLLLGGSDAAAAKARLLRMAGADIRLIADHLEGDMQTLVRAGDLTVTAPKLAKSHIQGCRLAFDDGLDPAASEILHRFAACTGLLVNTIDTPEACDFIIPAIIDRSPVVVAVSTGGASPTLAKILRQRIETALPQGLGRLTQQLAGFRDRLKQAIPQGRGRMRFWDRFLTDEGLDSLCAAPAETVAEDLEAALTTPVDSAKGSIALVGAGPGDPGLLTLEAAKALRTADVVLHDALVSPEILAMTRKEARVIPVGKRAGQPSVPQDMTNQLMLSHAKRGERVVRLKGGDPFVFGRGGEEQDFLQAHGIQPQVLCGVSAAFGIAARLGLPLTYRGESRALTLATASFDETAGQSGQPDWAKLANPSATLCLYMAGRHMGQAAQALIDHGLTPETPLVGIWDGTGQSHAHHFMTLAQAAEDFATDKTPFGPKETPVLFIIGDAVAHSPASTLSATKVLESRPSAGKVFDHNSVGVAL